MTTKLCKYGCGTMIDFIGQYPNGKPFEADNTSMAHTQERCESLKGKKVSTAQDTSKPYRQQGTPLDLTEVNTQLADIRGELREIHRVMANYAEVISKGSFSTADKVESEPNRGVDDV